MQPNINITDKVEFHLIYLLHYLSHIVGSVVFVNLTLNMKITVVLMY